ncbi:MAG: hypothetical protein ABIR67_07745 [Gaiellaceae bacterium]
MPVSRGGLADRDGQQARVSGNVLGHDGDGVLVAGCGRELCRGAAVE